MLWSVPSCHMIILVSYVPCKVECYILRLIAVLGVWYDCCQCSTGIKPGVGDPENAGVIIYSTYTCVYMFVIFPGNLQSNFTWASLQLPS